MSAIAQILAAFSGGSPPPPVTYATWNPADIDDDYSLTNGDLTITHTGVPSAWSAGRATIGKSAGKWYWEYTIDVWTSTGFLVGIANASCTLLNYLGSTTDGYGYQDIALKYNGSGAAYGATYTTGDVIGVALDMDAGTIEMYKNGVSQGVMYSGLTGTLYPAVSVHFTNDALTANFGASAFAYTVPAGFNAGLY